MPDVTPSMVFPIPGYNQPLPANHGCPTCIGGMDIFAPTGSPLVALTGGKVIEVGTPSTDPLGGNNISVQAPNGLVYYYAHMLNRASVNVGDTVTAGQQIGQVDTTGNAATLHTDPHLHIGIGYGITLGSGPQAGIGKNFDAVSLLKNLQANPATNTGTYNDVNMAMPEINAVPSVPGFDKAHLSDIQTNLDAALKAGIDPFVWLAIVAHESNFQDGVVNPTSGACGYAQLDPCEIGKELGSLNADTGLAKLVAFLKACNGDLTCALDNHYSGGIPGYAALIKRWADAIEQANPELAQAIQSGTYKGSQGTGSVTVGPGSSGGGSGSTSTTPCPPIPIQVGPATAYFPDVGCMITQGVKQLTQSLTNWWSTWQTQHVPTWIFAGIGIILVLIGLSVLAGSSDNPVGQAAQKATKIVGPELLAA